MNLRQENRFGMYLAVRDFLLTGTETTKDLPDFEVNFNAFRKTIDEINRIAEIQSFDKTGFALEKRQLQDVLILLANDNSQKLTAFAKLSSKTGLEKEVRFTKSKLSQAKDTIIRDFAMMIYSKAQDHLGSLAIYGITEETQAVMLNAINAYNLSISKPRLGQTEKSAATKQLAELFQAADTLLEKIDAVINIIMLKQPEFFKRYRDLRKIITSGTGTLALRGFARETPSGLPLGGVKFSFFSEEHGMKSGNGELTRKTAKGGSFYLKSIPEGTYNVKVTRTGYKEKIVNVSVVPGELTDLTVELEKA